MATSHPSKLLAVENLGRNHVALALLLFPALPHERPLVLKKYLTTGFELLKHNRLKDLIPRQHYVHQLKGDFPHLEMFADMCEIFD